MTTYENSLSGLVPISALAAEFGISKQEVRQAAKRAVLSLFVSYRSAETYVNRAGAEHLRSLWKEES